MEKQAHTADIHEQLGGSQIDFNVIDVSDYPPFRYRLPAFGIIIYNIIYIC